MTTDWFILARAVHFGVCLLFFGVFAFDRFITAPLFAGTELGAAIYWQSQLRKFSLFLPPLMLVSGAAWLVLVAATMSGLPPAQALQPDILKAVLAQTQFGRVWEARAILWSLIVTASLVYNLPSSRKFESKLIWFQLVAGGLLLGSLVWAGHGQEDSVLHLLADILHLLVAGLWPAGLLPLTMLLSKLRRSSPPAHPRLAAALVNRFSTMSLGAVTLLGLTGWVNAWFLAGSLANLTGETYGRWLLAKIILFVVAVAIGAVNLFWLKPRLSLETSTEVFETAARRLQFNVRVELAIGTIIIVIVGLLGILPPAAH